METNNILNADVLDIIFDGRNKQYGAYQLRKNYNKRLAVAIAAMFGFTLLAIAGEALAGNDNNKPIAPKVADGFVLVELKDKPITPPPPPPPPPLPQDPPKIEMIKDFPPVIVKEEVPPLATQAEMDSAVLGSINQHGLKNVDQVAPPVEAVSTGAPKELVHEESNDEGAIVQIQAQFPGGIAAWMKYLERNLRQDIPVDNGAPAGDYKVIVSFIVDKDGSISQVKAENDPGYGIAAEAVRVIQKSGKWTPAIQNGRNVTYRQQQPITFRASEQ